MDKDNYLNGFRLTFENAKRLFKAAEYLEERKEFPIANSLLVLSAEEGVKAYILLIKHLFPKVKFDLFYKFFRDHDLKLNTIQNLVLFFFIFQKIDELFYQPMIATNGLTEVEILMTRQLSFQNLIEQLSKEANTNNTDLDKELNWWENAKNLKEKGFYVEFNEGIWASPNILNEEKYIETKRYVSSFFIKIEKLKDLNYEDEEVKRYLKLIETSLIDTLKNKNI